MKLVSQVKVDCGFLIFHCFGEICPKDIYGYRVLLNWILVDTLKFENQT